MILKKIAFLIPSLGPGGAERVVVSLANKLCHSHAITLILLYKEHNILYEIDKKIKIICCAEYLQKSNGFIQALKNNKNNINKISNIIKNESIDIIIGFTTTCNILSVISAKKNKIPSIISDRSNPYVTNLSLFWKTVRRLVYPMSDYLVVQSQLSKSFYSYIKKNKIIILPNPLSETLVDKKNDLTQKENIILYVARLDTNKSQDTLLKAFANLENVDWKLVLVGDGNKREYYENYSEKLNLGERVVFTGRINNPGKYYNKAKIFAFTSKSEGFPNALIEAMFFGLPCVSTNCPSGPSELIQDGDNGFLIPIGDSELLSEKLKYLIENKDVRLKMSKKACLKAEKFHINSVCSSWENLIISLI